MAGVPLIDTGASNQNAPSSTAEVSDHHTGKNWAITSWLRANVSLVLELLTAGVGVAAFVVAFFVQISQEALIEITIALLALLSITTLLQRATKLENVERHIISIHRFLFGGTLDAKIHATASAANESARNLQGGGVINVYDTLADVHLAHEISSTSRSIRILSNWVDCLTELGEIFTQKAEAGCQIRILVLRHDSIFAKLRSDELGGCDSDAVPRQISAELEAFDRLFREHPTARTNLQVKAFNARPPICMFGYDDVRFTGFFWPRLNAMNAPFLRLKDQREPGRGSTLAAIIDSQFESLWNDPETKYVRIDNGKPAYVDQFKDAWRQQQDSETITQKLSMSVGTPRTTWSGYR